MTSLLADCEPSIKVVFSEPAFHRSTICLAQLAGLSIYLSFDNVNPDGAMTGNEFKAVKRNFQSTVDWDLPVPCSPRGK